MLRSIDFSVVSKMTAETPGLLGKPDAPISHVILKGNGKKAVWLVYAGEGMASVGYVKFKLDGKVAGKKKF